MKKTVLILGLSAAMAMFGCSDNEEGPAGSGGSGGGDGGSGGGAGDGGGGNGGSPPTSGSTTWVATTTPAGSNGGPTATGGGCEVFVTALNTTINLELTLQLDVTANGGNNVDTAWQLDAQQFLLPTLGNAAELGALSIAAEVTGGAVGGAEPGSIGSALTAAAEGQTIGAFTTGDVLSLATPGEVTAGNGDVDATPTSGATFSVNWDGTFALDLTLGGAPLITVDEEVCTFDVLGDDVVLAFDGTGGAGGNGGAGGAGGAGGG